MTEFEMAYLLTDMQSAIGNQSAVFFTGVSGFLVGGYVAAHRLNRALIAIVISVYTLWFLQMMFLLSRMSISLAGLVTQIHEFAEAGKGLQWHGAAIAKAPDWVFDLQPYPSYIIGLIVYGATIYFFFHCLSVSRKAELAVEAPKT